MVKACGARSHMLVHAALCRVLLVHLAATCAPEGRNLLAVKVEGGQAGVALPAHRHVVPLIIHPTCCHPDMTMTSRAPEAVTLCQSSQPCVGRLC